MSCINPTNQPLAIIVGTTIDAFARMDYSGLRNISVQQPEAKTPSKDTSWIPEDYSSL